LSFSSRFQVFARLEIFKRKKTKHNKNKQK
jgi:hypothetical protein